MNKKKKSAEDHEVETRKLSNKQAIHQVQYFLRFACFQNTKKGQIRESPWDVVYSSGLIKN